MTAIIVTLLMLTGREMPPKYFDGKPLRSCATWNDPQTVCCGWRDEAGGVVACHQGEEWVVVAEGGE